MSLPNLFNKQEIEQLREEISKEEIIKALETIKNCEEFIEKHQDEILENTEIASMVSDVARILRKARERLKELGCDGDDGENHNHQPIKKAA
ncbi:MAG: hypothetical protein V1707_01120 [bacterium]